MRMMITLSPEAVGRLRAMAQQEKRDVRGQAAFIVERAVLAQKQEATTK